MNSDRELIYMQKPISKTAIKLFEKGFELFKDGDWSAAKKHFEHCLLKKPEDGPTMVIMNFMKDKSFIRPLNWSGSREVNDQGVAIDTKVTVIKKVSGHSDELMEPFKRIMSET